MRKPVSMAGLTAALRESDWKRAPTRRTESSSPTLQPPKPRGTTRAVAACATPIGRRLTPPADRYGGQTVAGAEVADSRWSGIASRTIPVPLTLLLALRSSSQVRSDYGHDHLGVLDHLASPFRGPDPIAKRLTGNSGPRRGWPRRLGGRRNDPSRKRECCCAAEAAKRIGRLATKMARESTVGARVTFRSASNTPSLIEGTGVESAVDGR
jgi:hypothetical protein